MKKECKMKTVDIFKMITEDPASSHWLINALRGMQSRDPVDILRDVDKLQWYAKQKAREAGL